jgi:tetratricopeptide (TPR) repeat protein
VWSEREEIRPALDRLADRSSEKFATLASVFARALVDWGDVPYAGKIARRAVGAIDDQHPHAAFIHLSAGVLAWGVRDLDRALTEARYARRLAAKSGDNLVEARARNAAAIALSNQGRREEALEELRAGLESLGDSLPEVRYSMQNVMAMQYWFAGRYAEGAAAARRALAISSEATVSRAMTVGTLAICLAGLGDAIGAAEAQREAADLIIRFEVRGSGSETLVNFGRIALVAGDEAHAAAFVAAGKRLAAELRSVVEDPLWDDPSYGALIDRYPDEAGSLDGLSWEDALRSAIAWRPPASAARG